MSMINSQIRKTVMTVGKNSQTGIMGALYSSEAGANIVNKTIMDGINFMDASENNSDIQSDDLFADKKVVVVGVVGAFTGVCNNQVPLYSDKLDQFKEKGVDTVAVVTANDPHVNRAWKEMMGVEPELRVLTDVKNELARSLDLNLDLTAGGFGERSQRYTLVVDNKKIVSAVVEDSPGEVTVTAADAVLESL
eukprot:TRINITY_DN5539_c0_g1_i3.p1 TRINITY_DN5539_c0_g1~~TRINITY_DN5539_c0_g1_i3.p1  ORF type:complete len:193 (+),score=69.59 TRINITY_DN5539_c0_g1_i3:109-687(+)